MLIKRYMKDFFKKKKGKISDSPHNVNIENDRCMRHAHF